MSYQTPFTLINYSSGNQAVGTGKNKKLDGLTAAFVLICMERNKAWDSEPEINAHDEMYKTNPGRLNN